LDPTYQPVQQPELAGVPRARVSLHKVFILYREQFWRWFCITAPTSVIACVVLYMADQRIRTIFGSIPRGEIQYHWAEIAETGVLRFGGFFISWLLGAFALGAIASAVGNLDSNDDEVWRHDSHRRPREYFLPLLIIAVFTYCAFLVGMSMDMFVNVALVRLIGWAHYARFNLFATVAGYVVIAGIVSWFGAAIPIVLRGDIGTWAALKRSVKLSNGYEGFLFLLVIESVVGSYVAWYATPYALTLMFPASLRQTEWYGWLVYLVAVLAAAAVEPPLFIGFSLLAADESPASHSVRARRAAESR